MGDVRPPPPGAYGVQGAEENIIFPENEVTRKQTCQREESSLLAVTFRVAKCHGYDGYIRVKELANWGKKLGRNKKLAKTSHF